MRQVTVSGRWPLMVAAHKAERPGWEEWERDRLAHMWSAIRPGDVVVDVGAEGGDLSALYATWGAEVVLIEPSAKMWPEIKATFAANDAVPVAMFHGFAGPQRTLGADVSGAWPAAASGRIIPDPGFAHLDERPDIPSVTLDLLRSLDPAVVTMDVEGSEYEVLLGAEQLLQQRTVTWFISVHPEFMADRWNRTPDDLLTLMTKHGYDSYFVGFDHEYHWEFKPCGS